MHFQRLKDLHRQTRDQSAPELSLRIHRALSWLHKAELSEDDLDAQFIFLWISFNAAYAVDVDLEYRTTEKGMFMQFFESLVRLDEDKQLYNLVWSEFSGVIRVLLDNEYIYQPFWDYHNGKLSEDEWKISFAASKKRASIALAHQDTTQVLSIVFRRIYTLRNQIMHGGATWQGKVNRSQLKDSVSLLKKIVPVMLELMLQHNKNEWGEPFYPVTGV
ncbi:hypothetical protein DN062_02205 [Nitrincola tibetensis]|uniref:Uncharacterized protein n=1 Tax=Nitrincola tibetensis TaxID=2219697 RepID=A0A364NSN7_9GAMM|nr:HEPN domain-containing protein [Nitrincola tibetensis]RAU19907.1 hypothetical protein DN062_02205 [Nitrincola tibetensis]